MLENIAGDGGGFGVFSGMPAYQRQFPGIGKFSAVKTITPIDPTNVFPGFPTAALRGARRLGDRQLAADGVG